MSLFSRKAKRIEPAQGLDMIRYAAKILPELEEMPDVAHLAELENTTRANLLRRLYLDAEERVLKRPDSPWSSSQEMRADIAKHFKVEKRIPTGFSVLFLSRSGQMFWLFQQMLQELWKRAEWNTERVMGFFAEAAAGTPLEEVRTLSEEGWQAAHKAFGKLPEGKQEAGIVSAFRRVLDKSFREFITEKGESRARIALEEVGRALNEDFGMLDVIPEVMQALPEGVLAEDRITYSSKAELQKTVRQQMQELRGKNMALIAEAKQLHETIQRLEESRDHAESMAKAQQDFVQVVMHQFRTPLAALRWQAEALLDVASEHPEIEDLGPNAEVIRQRSSFLVGQLENIFDLLALQSGDYKISTTKLDLGHTLETLCQEMGKDAQMHGVALTCSAGDAPEVQADPDAIHRVLRIMITNAINYSNEGGSVSVAHEVVQRGSEGGEVRVHIKDSGIGIRPDDRPKLFTKFYRGKNAIHKVADGAGIGLFISKSIIELHGGRMWADSPGEGEGAQFSFSLPLEATPEEKHMPKSSVPADAGRAPAPPPAPEPKEPEPAPAPAPAPVPQAPSAPEPPASVPPTTPKPIEPVEETSAEAEAASPPTPPTQQPTGDVDPLLGS